MMEFWLKMIGCYRSVSVNNQFPYFFFHLDTQSIFSSVLQLSRTLCHISVHKNVGELRYLLPELFFKTMLWTLPPHLLDAEDSMELETGLEKWFSACRSQTLGME